jgi:hypothetical protein
MWVAARIRGSLPLDPDSCLPAALPCNNLGRRGRPGLIAR